jgi:pyrroline-5-carboxylate reductase
MKTTIGIIGVGTISTAIVEGFCSGGDCEHEFVLSPRKSRKAAALTAKYPNVRVADSNQQVLDRSQWVIVAVVPRIGREVLEALRFRPDHCVIDLMTDHTLAEVASIIGPTRELVRMVPLPFIARRSGPIVVYPHNAPVAELFARLGEIIQVDSEKAWETCSVTTALMSSFYKLTGEIVRWGTDEGLGEEQAVRYCASFFGALLGMVKNTDAGGIERLAGEMTPGGLNEMALLHIDAAGGFGLWPDALSGVMERIQKRKA